MKYILMILIVTCGVIAFGADIDYEAVGKYWYSQNISSNDIPNDLRKIVMVFSKKGNITLKWQVNPKPTDEWIQANKEVAKTWLDDYKKEQEADVDKWSPRDNAETEMLREEMNTLRTALGLPEITDKQWKKKIKDKIKK